MEGVNLGGWGSPKFMPTGQRQRRVGPSQPTIWGGMWSPLTPLSPFTIVSVLEHLSNLSKEVNLDYERSMNKINFDQIVSSKPDTFSYVTLPKKEEEKVPRQGERGWTKAPWSPTWPEPSCPSLLLPQLPGELGWGWALMKVLLKTSSLSRAEGTR